MLILNSKASAEKVIYCSHPELCRMINQLTDTKTESLISISGDPHEYEPSITEIKKLIAAAILITGPSELNPWIKKVIFQRSKNLNIKTISAIFDQKDFQLYLGASPEAISHFWLYPKVYCALKNKMEVNLKNLQLILKTKSGCEFKKTEEQLQSVLLQIKKPIILTHDALLPLFLNLVNKSNIKIIAIKGSGHHEEANPNSIKNMYNALSAPSVIWIAETGINIPQNILNKMRPSDVVIKIDTGKSKSTEVFSVLNELSEKLLPYIEK